MEIAYSRNRVPVRMTDERWRHIVSRHPEMRWQRHRVLEAIASPDLVQRGDYGALLALRYYNQPPAVNLFIVAVYRELDEADGFVITAYLTRRPNRDREVLWSR